jgi:hypothetical protein
VSKCFQHDDPVRRKPGTLFRQRRLHSAKPLRKNYKLISRRCLYRCPLPGQLDKSTLQHQAFGTFRCWLCMSLYTQGRTACTRNPVDTVCMGRKIWNASPGTFHVSCILLRKPWLLCKICLGLCDKPVPDIFGHMVLDRPNRGTVTIGNVSFNLIGYAQDNLPLQI